MSRMAVHVLTPQDHIIQYVVSQALDGNPQEHASFCHLPPSSYSFNNSKSSNVILFLVKQRLRNHVIFEEYEENEKSKLLFAEVC